MSSNGRLRSPASVVLTVLGFLVPVVLYFWLISADGVDMLRADQWYDISLIHHSATGTLRFGMLWDQHGENRVFFQNVITLVLGHFTNFNVLVEEYIGAVLMTGVAVLVILTHHRRSPATPWIAYCPVAIMVLTLAQWGGTLYGYSFGWYIIAFSLALALYFLDRIDLTWFAWGAAVAAGVVSSFSSLQGLFIWPVGLALILQRSRGRRFAIGWIVAALATAGIYFYNWHVGQGGSTSYAVHHPFEALRYFLFAVGDVVAVQLPNSPSGPKYGVLVLGVVITGVGIWAIISCGFRRDESSTRPFGVALVWFGLLFAVGAAGARTSFGVSNAGFTLYVTFDLMILLGSYLIVIDRSDPVAELAHQSAAKALMHARWLTGMTVVVGVIVGLQTVLGTVNGITSAHDDRGYQLRGAVVTAKVQRAPDGLVESQLGAGDESVAFIRQMAGYARAQHLSLFSTAAATRYAQQKLPVNRTPPTTRLGIPTEGEVLRGTTNLVASASDTFGVTKVEFVLRGKNNRPLIVSQSGATNFGWFGEWDTTTVPDGNYTLRSVAYAPGGQKGTSLPVAVRVAN